MRAWRWADKRYSVAHVASRLLRNRCGAITILMAVAMPLVFIVVGFAADYGYASYLNQRLGRACDAAALSAASQAAATGVGGYSTTSALQSYGSNIFAENIKDLPISNVAFTLTVSQDPATTMVSTTASYSYTARTFFSNFFGVAGIPVAGVVRASVQPPTYINYYILVDVSNSMGIGATQSEMAALYNKLSQLGFSQNGEPGCVFACHDPNSGSNYQYSTEDIARQIGVTLRIDSAVSAIKSIISSASAVAGATKNISFGIYLLQANPNTGKKVVILSSPSTNYSYLSTLASNIDLGSNSGSNTAGDTDFQRELSTFNGLLGTNGSGASAASPLNYVFLVTDGVGDQITGSCSSSSCVFPINSTWCDNIKQKSTLGVIYTTYLPIYKSNNPSKGYERTFHYDSNAGALQQNATREHATDAVAGKAEMSKAR